MKIYRNPEQLLDFRWAVGYNPNVLHTEVYRSGHNGPDSKSGSPHGLVGSNPTASAKKLPVLQSRVGSFIFWCPTFCPIVPHLSF